MPDPGHSAAPRARRRCVLVCQYRSCQRSGSAAVLSAFQAADLPTGIFATASGCLGQCGSGPNVLISPDNTFYCHVQPRDVEVVVEQHLKQDQPVKALLHPRFHAEYDVYAVSQLAPD